jgi:hypothetical protein
VSGSVITNSEHPAPESTARRKILENSSGAAAAMRSGGVPNVEVGHLRVLVLVLRVAHRREVYDLWS